VLPFIKIKPFLTGMEKGLSMLSPDSIESIVDKQPLAFTSLDSPMGITYAPKRDFPGVPLSRMAPPQQQEEDAPEPVRVTFILTEGERKMAIVNGIVVKEGDMIQSGTVARIEKDRVLIKSEKEQRWVKID
jgi:hypothetical protein